MIRKNSIRKWRTAITLFFFVSITFIAARHQVVGGGPNGAPSIEAYCPFGAAASLYTYLTTGEFIRRIHPSSLVLLLAVVLLTLVTRKAFCGWVCPFGTLQEWVGKLGKKILGKRFNPSFFLDKYLRYLKYILLTVIVFFSWKGATLVFRDYDPYLAFFHFGLNASNPEIPCFYTLTTLFLRINVYTGK